MSTVRLEKLNLNQLQILYEFELENKSYFDSIGLSRPDSYYNLTSFSESLNELILEQEEQLHLMYCVFNDDEIVGRINLFNIKDSTAEVGYRISEKHQGKGYASKALKLLLEIAYDLKFTKIHAGCDRSNIASQNVLIKNGFVLNKIIPIEEMYEGATEDGMWFEKEFSL